MIIDPTYCQPDTLAMKSDAWTTMVAGELGFRAFPDAFGISFHGAPDRKHPAEQVAVTVFIDPVGYAAAADYLETLAAELRDRIVEVEVPGPPTHEIHPDQCQCPAHRGGA